MLCYFLAIRETFEAFDRCVSKIQITRRGQYGWDVQNNELHYCNHYQDFEHRTETFQPDMTLRSFIAIPFTSEIQEAITNRTSSLRRSLEKPIVRWIPSHDIHLTLKFLGNVMPADLEILAQDLMAEARKHSSFRMTLGGIGVFPNKRRPRIIWMGIEATENLKNLFQAIESITTKLGYDPEKRLFSPHLTIGRVSQQVTTDEIHNISEALTQTHIEALKEEATVASICIFRSDLKPTGAVYTLMYTAPLSN